MGPEFIKPEPQYERINYTFQSMLGLYTRGIFREQTNRLKDINEVALIAGLSNHEVNNLKIILMSVINLSGNGKIMETVTDKHKGTMFIEYGIPGGPGCDIRFRPEFKRDNQEEFIWGLSSEVFTSNQQDSGRLFVQMTPTSLMYRTTLQTEPKTNWLKVLIPSEEITSINAEVIGMEAFVTEHNRKNLVKVSSNVESGGEIYNFSYEYYAADTVIAQEFWFKRWKYVNYMGRQRPVYVCMKSKPHGETVRRPQDKSNWIPSLQNLLGRLTT